MTWWSCLTYQTFYNCVISHFNISLMSFKSEIFIAAIICYSHTVKLIRKEDNVVNDWLKRFIRFPQIFSWGWRNKDSWQSNRERPTLWLFAVFWVAAPEVSLTLRAAVVRPAAGRTHEVGFLQWWTVNIKVKPVMVIYLLCHIPHTHHCWLLAAS